MSVSSCPRVSVLIITYERLDMLVKTLETFREHTDYPNVEIIISDDGSSRSTIKKIAQLGADRIVTSHRRRTGLGANCNRGISKCSGQFILSLQDDWECHGPSDYLGRSVDALMRYPGLGAIRYYGINDTDYSSQDIIDGDGDLRILTRPGSTERHLRQLYSDTPHLKKAAFVKAVGPYREACRMERCETDYQERFLQQYKFEIAYFRSYNNRVFTHIGEQVSYRTRGLQHRLTVAVAPISKVTKTAFPGIHDKCRKLMGLCSSVNLTADLP